MIYTITLNPSIDYVMRVEELKAGSVNRSSSEEMLSGGKGINVSAVLGELGVRSRALGFVAGFTGRELARLSGRGVRAVVDAERGLLLNTLKYKPFLIKPNLDELGRLFNAQPRSLEDVESLARRLREMGSRNVLVSMAGDGALLLDERGELHSCPACRGAVQNSVGAGDSMIAGFLAALEERPGDFGYALKLGTASGGATAFSIGLAKREEILKLLSTCI